MKKFLKALCFAALFLAGLGLLYRIFMWKDTAGSYMSSTESFYAINDKDRVDVLFVGPSYSYHSMNPASLWQKTGIASFAMTISGQDKKAAYSYVKEVLKTQTLKVVVVDYSEAIADTYAVKSNLYRNLLSMKLSKENYEMIDSIVEEKEDVLSYLLRWPIVHTRYKELSEYDFEQYQPSIYSLGHLYSFDIVSWKLDETVAACEEKTPISENNKIWVDNLTALAKENGFELLFTFTPCSLSLENKKIINGFEEYLDEQGLAYINFDKKSEEAGIDTELHYVDHGHMNHYGSEKVMAYLADYFAGHYSLEDHRGDEDYEPWERAVEYEEHVLAKQKCSNAVNALYLADVTSKLEEVTVVLSLEGDFMGVELDVLSLFDALGIPADDLEQGGTWVIENGEVLARLPGDTLSSYTQKMSASTLLSVRRQLNSEGNAVLELSVGQEKYQAVSVYQYGVYFMVYDKMTNEPLVNQWFR